MSSIFGPVYSRRFGVSLGVDLSSQGKQCNFDCLYCELAPQMAQTQQTIVTPLETIVADIRQALIDHPQIDVITLTANGEPTMYPYLNELIDQIDQFKGDKQTLILSNSAGLSDPKTFSTLLKLDQVKLSLDAATPFTFKKIDRPAEGIEIEKIIDAINRFSHQFKGKLFIEILIVKGLNDIESEIKALNAALLPIRCDRIDIGTIDRPPAYPVEGIGYDKLYAISHQFDPSLPVHIVSRSKAHAKASSFSDQEILSTLDKRPLTADDIDALFDAPSQERFQSLLETGGIVSIERSNIIFYLPAQNLHRKRSK